MENIAKGERIVLFGGDIMLFDEVFDFKDMLSSFAL